MTTLSADIDRLLALGRALDREALAARTMRYLERWTPPGHEREIAELVAADLAEAGAEVELDEEFPASPSVIARVRGPEPGPTIQWHGHLDAIATEHAPARRDGDELIARGASDMKGAVSANVTSLALLREAGLPRRGSILMTYHGLHEEGGSAPLIRLIERGIVGDAVMTGELGSGRELVTASRGLDFWAIEIERDGRSIHDERDTGARRPAAGGRDHPRATRRDPRRPGRRHGLASGQPVHRHGPLGRLLQPRPHDVLDRRDPPTSRGRVARRGPCGARGPGRGGAARDRRGHRPASTRR